MAVLRSFSIVGALAAAVLALVIGVLAFNSHSSPNGNQPPSIGPNQTGVAAHPVSAPQLTSRGGGALVDLRGQQPVQVSRVSPPEQTYSSGGFVASAGSAFGSQASAPSAALPACNPGLLGGLLALVGGLLGGSGSAC
jgi:hypothetical protein